MAKTSREPIAAHLVAYTEDGIEAARELVSVAAGPDAAAVFQLIAQTYRIEPRQIFSLVAFDALGWPIAGLKGRLRAAANAFYRAFDVCLLSGLDRSKIETEDAVFCAGIAMSSDLASLFDRPPAALSAPTTLLDNNATTWATLVIAAAGSAGGHHLALRCVDGDRRSVADFAAHLAAAGAHVICWSGDEPLQAKLLGAELFGGKGTVVVADGPWLVDPIQTGDDSEADVPSISTPALSTNRLTTSVLSWFRSLSGTYVWRIPERGVLPPELRRLVAACFGPLRQDPDWRAAHLKGLAAGIDAQGARILLAQVDDARDVEPMARLAVAIAQAGVPQASSVGAACTLIASLQAEPTAATHFHNDDFDEALIACEPDGVRLLERARTLTQGARVLVHGHSGGGKSSYARELTTRIAEASGGAPVVVEPAALLAKSWGSTERLVAALWQRAHRANACLLADEFDSLAGLREAEAPASGNAHLIRILTNEWLRQMDAYPRVPLVVTINDIDALDPAIRRRFAIAIEVRDELSEEQELHAWHSLLGMAPPAGWTPCRASVGDFASARERCRLLGRDDAAAHAIAVAEARAVRLGRRKGGRGAKKGRLH